MSLWVIIPLIVWLIGFLIFLFSMLTEAPKYGAKVGVTHILVALFWPAWLIWYVCVILNEKFTSEG